MIISAPMLIGPAKKAGMKVPFDADNFNPKDYPHFSVFCSVQLGAPMPSWTSHWTNAKIIAAIPDNKIKTITYRDLTKMGFEIGYPMP